jgi:phage tail-like protein
VTVDEKKDPYHNYRFLVEIDGVVGAGFNVTTISDSTQDTIEYREGNETLTVRKVPGSVKYGNVTLKRGITNSTEFYNWRKQVEQGKLKDARRNMVFILIDEEGKAKAKCEFSNAWPSKYDASDLDGKGNDVTIETLDIVHEGMVRVS